MAAIVFCSRAWPAPTKPGIFRGPRLVSFECIFVLLDCFTAFAMTAFGIPVIATWLQLRAQRGRGEAGAAIQNTPSLRVGEADVAIQNTPSLRGGETDVAIQMD